MPVHPTAVISPDAVIHPSSCIGPYCVVDGPVSIGAGTVCGPFVHLLGHTEVGRDCRIHSGCVLGDAPQDRSFQGGVSFCRIGDAVVLREHVTVHRGTTAGSATSIGNRCWLMAGAHVGHNCLLADDVTLANGSLLGGYVQIGRGATLSGNVGVHQFVRIGELAMIGGLAKITQDVLPGFLIDGPGVCIGINRVGLQRAGVAAADISEALQAYRLLCRTPGSLQSAIDRLHATFATVLGRSIVEFVSSSSRRGFHLQSPARRRRAAAE